MCSPHPTASHSIFKDSDKENSYSYPVAQSQVRASQHSQSHTSSLSFHVTQSVGESQDLVRLEADAQDEAAMPAQSCGLQQTPARGSTGGQRGPGVQDPHNKDAAAQWSVLICSSALFPKRSDVVQLYSMFAVRASFPYPNRLCQTETEPFLQFRHNFTLSISVLSPSTAWWCRGTRRAQTEVEACCQLLCLTALKKPGPPANTASHAG